jgi:polar amino acid transport system substrate-binding protein
MNKIISSFLFIFVFVLFNNTYALDKQNKTQLEKDKIESITIVADTWCPYNCNPESPHQGFIIDIAKKAFAKHNIEVKYIVLPWTQAINETRKGKYTAIIGAAIGDAPDFIFPKTSQGFMQNSFYVKKSANWKYTGIKSLNNIILGAIADYSYSDELDNYIRKYRLDPAKLSMMSGDDALGINLSMLKRNKIGAILEEKYVMSYYLSMHNMKGDIQEAGALPTSENNNLYIAFSPKDKKSARRYAEILSQETTKMRESGELKEIMDIYGLDDWK